MADPTPALQTLDTATIREEWAAVIERVAHQQTRVLVEEDGVPVAALIPLADLRRLAQLDERRSNFLATLDQLQDVFADVPDDELAREIDQALAAARAERDNQAGR